VEPKLITQDFAGVHNSNNGGSRILKGGTWKKQRIVVIIPAADMIPARVALTHWNIIFPPNQNVFRILAQGMEVGEAYSMAIEQVLGHPELSAWEYILTVEHDNTPPPDGVLRLIQRMEERPDLSCVRALLYKGRGWGSADLGRSE
jgi:hypothetical protein